MLWVLPSSGSVLGQQVLEWTFQYLLHTLWSWLKLSRRAKVETDGAACGLLRKRSRPISFHPWFGSVLPSPPSLSPRGVLTAGTTCHTWVAPGPCILMQKLCIYKYHQFLVHPGYALVFGSATPEGLYFSSVFQTSCRVNGALFCWTPFVQSSEQWQVSPAPSPSAVIINPGPQTDPLAMHDFPSLWPLMVCAASTPDSDWKQFSEKCGRLPRGLGFKCRLYQLNQHKRS